ncbi:MAG: hypothetical protein KDI32_07615, partial [Pseudomonadales bacterium]|nr:hypothetical protein [Pseudomonadales bacterium]
MTRDDTADAQRRRGRRTLLIIAAIFFVPLAISFALYYGTPWRPDDRTNKGELIHPAKPLPTATLRESSGRTIASNDLLAGKWSIIYIANGACDSDCRAALVTVRQVRLALANEMSRVQRVFLATADCCDNEYLAREHLGLTVIDASDAAGTAFSAAFPVDDRAHGLYIVDPRGNRMMRNDARENPK